MTDDQQDPSPEQPQRVPLTDALREEMTRPVTGMTLARFGELLKQEKNGQDLVFLEGEEAQYKERKKADARLQKIMTSFDTKHIERALQASASPSLPSFEVHNPAWTTNHRLADIAETLAGQGVLNEGNAEHLKLTAQALADMLTISQAESEAAKERDRLARERDAAAKDRDEAAQKAQRTNLRVAIGSLVAAVLAVIAPFVIESIKGWQ